MRSLAISFTVLLALGLSLISAGCMQSDSSTAVPTPESTTVPQAQYTSNETLVAFVESAVAYVQENGKKTALAEFNDPNGAFVRGELYIYAYDFNGTTLAHPVNPEKVGVNRLNETEGGVGTFLREMNDAVRNGDGFGRIAYINPPTRAGRLSRNWRTGGCRWTRTGGLAPGSTRGGPPICPRQQTRRSGPITLRWSASGERTTAPCTS